MFFSIRGMVRIISFTAAAFLFLLGIVVASTARTDGYRRQLELGYLRSVQEISSHMSSLSVDMQKAAYAGTPAQTAALAAKISRDAAAAKAALGNLPVGEMNLEATHRFLSQVGDYTQYLSRQTLNSQELSQEDRDNFDRLVRHADQFHRQMADLERLFLSGEAEIEESLKIRLGDAEDSLSAAVQTGLGFQDVEDGFQGYPTLIYDGPFSDNLLEKAPAMTEGQAEISRSQALETAAKFAGLETFQLAEGDDELSRMPSYTFHGTQADVGVTVQGGYVTYLINGRDIGPRKLTADEAREQGRAFLAERGIRDMAETYYELAGGIFTINYAYTLGDVTCYTDLIKVGIAADNGQAVFYDARGFLSNHKERDLAQPVLTGEEAAESVSKNLQVRSVRKALIPTQGGNEVLAYEFACKGLKGEDVLVYVNGETGAEEQILILIQNENGTLTM